MTSPEDPQPELWNHLNGTNQEIFDRFCISELCKSWPLYRDASEWKNYRDSFVDESAVVWTTWGGATPIDKFIEVSKQGKAAGDFIMHRECGTLVDLNPKTDRGVGKMKATITQRFKKDNIEFDVDCDCEFIFFCLRTPDRGWRTQYVKLFYDKDKVVPIDGRDVPDFPHHLLDQYPRGYQYLSVAQHWIGHPILNDLPTLDNKAWKMMYKAMDQWLKGEKLNLHWEDESGFQ